MTYRSLDGLTYVDTSELIINGITSSILYTDSDSIVNGVSYDSVTNGYLYSNNNLLSFQTISLTDLTNTLTANRVLINNTSQIISVSDMSDTTLNLFNSNFVLTSTTIKINFPLSGTYSRLINNSYGNFNSLGTNMNLIEFGNEATGTTPLNMYKFNGLTNTSSLYIIPGYYYNGTGWSSNATALTFDIPTTGILYFSDSISVFNNLYGSRYTNSLTIIPDIDFQNYKSVFYAQSNIQYLLMGNGSNSSLNNYISLIDNSFQSYNDAGFSIYRQTSTNTTTLTNQGTGAIIFNNKTALNTGYQFQTETINRMTLTGTLLNISVETTIPTLNLTTLNLSGTFAPTSISTGTMTATSLINSSYITTYDYLLKSNSSKEIIQSTIYIDADNILYCSTIDLTRVVTGRLDFETSYLREDTSSNLTINANNSIKFYSYSTTNPAITINTTGTTSLYNLTATTNKDYLLVNNSSKEITSSSLYIDNLGVLKCDTDIETTGYIYGDNLECVGLVKAGSMQTSGNIITTYPGNITSGNLITAFNGVVSSATISAQSTISTVSGDIYTNSGNIYSSLGYMESTYHKTTQSIYIYSKLTQTVSGNTILDLTNLNGGFTIGSLAVNSTYDYVTLNTNGYYRIDLMMTGEGTNESGDFKMFHSTSSSDTFATKTDNTVCQSIQINNTSQACGNAFWIVKGSNGIYIRFYFTGSSIHAYSLSIVRIY